MVRVFPLNLKSRLILRLGYRVAQVRVIFTLPDRFPYREPLAYIEYFSPFRTQKKFSDLYPVKRSYKGSNRKEREAAVISLDSIRSSCHLIPNFGKSANQDLDYTSVLEECQNFFVNPYLDLDSFQFFLG